MSTKTPDSNGRTAPVTGVCETEAVDAARMPEGAPVTDDFLAELGSIEKEMIAIRDGATDRMIRLLQLEGERTVETDARYEASMAALITYVSKLGMNASDVSDCVGDVRRRYLLHLAGAEAPAPPAGGS